ncbi:unnamed protein product [Nippostrongylus brasiliensis]|uniref:Sodium-independent chloride/iodide transporter n=1 Tax=Nippostrongylus brasiliensis TaxID=27835 RepID=A0A158QZS1_NIPBR|nr:unnamed protein product [Nippostrongylus brasiliensis]
MMRKMPTNVEGAAILTGCVSNLQRAVSAFVRLRVPQIFRKVALHTQEPYTLADSADEFISQVVAVPPGKCSTETRWEPRETEANQTRSVGMLYATYHDDNDDDDDDSSSNGGHGGGIVRTGRLFGGLAQDLKTKLPWFVSDFTDFFSGRLSQSLAATIFLFFANITSIITFGAVMERILHHQMASMEAILSGGISGVIFAAFSGQPLNILSSTGPTLVFEKILFEFCVFTEEAFATLISVVFIIQAFQKLIEISHDAPIVADPREVYHSPCFCYLNETNPELNVTISVRLKDITGDECEARGGEAVGLQCHFKPDVYMLSVLLTFGTFALAYALNNFRNSKFFGSTFRNTLSDFGVVIAIIVATAFSLLVGLDVPSLHVPERFRPTLDRPWLIDISQTPLSVALISSLPAAFYTILIVMDQQITAVIINRKDNLLRLVPLPVLIGIFLYMGVVSLLGQQFVQRIALLFTSVKHQPDYSWLRSVRMRRVHLFTVIQLLSIGALFLVKHTKSISMIFPLMLVFMVLIRMFILEKIFTRSEMASLDDLLPSFKDVVMPNSSRERQREMKELIVRK